MVVLIWVALGLLAAALFIAYGALVELYRTVEQVRAHAGALDSRTKLDVSVSRHDLASSGLPNDVILADRALLMILSDRCGTCESIAERLAGGPPKDAWIVLQPYNSQSAAKWLDDHDFGDSPRVIVDDRERVIDALNIRLSPAVVRLRNGSVVAAHTLPSSRRLTEEMHWLRKDGPDEPEYGPVHESFDAVARQLEMSDHT
jgi:hypothetical protein